MSSGEGMQTRERNNGQNSSILLEIFPKASQASSYASLALYGQEGSLGFNQAQNHSAGGRLTGGYQGLHGGIEGLQSWGIDGDPTLTPFLLSGWVRYASKTPYLAYVRYDQQHWEESAASITHLGAGYRAANHARIWLGAQLHSRDPKLTDYPGASGLEEQQTIFIQFELNQKSTFHFGGKQ